MGEKLLTSKTKREYKCVYDGTVIVIPVGQTIQNRTAIGYDNNYRFWVTDKSVLDKFDIKKDYGTESRGINIPERFCEPYLIKDYQCSKRVSLRHYSNGYFLYSKEINGNTEYKVASSMEWIITEYCLAYKGNNYDEAFEAIIWKD